ncbi:hypothetical protein [Streptosporangium roseum]|uniref:hypothetical protein n=1 Tax=Streptosporangium roseum TaxID=2001 RepID=UPI0004CD5D8A|nr:hypothetical protein [Streptosporangium roseum]
MRPTICRVFGATEGLACPHGCEVIEGRSLTMAEGFALVDAAAVVGTVRQPMTAEQASQVLLTAQGRQIREHLLGRRGTPPASTQTVTA